MLANGLANVAGKQLLVRQHQASFHGLLSYSFWAHMAVEWSFEGPEVEEFLTAPRGKCMYIKKWTLAQIEALTQLQVSMFVGDKGYYFFLVKIREKHNGRSAVVFAAV